jgi:hypothetical protein
VLERLEPLRFRREACDAVEARKMLSSIGPFLAQLPLIMDGAQDDGQTRNWRWISAAFPCSRRGPTDCRPGNTIALFTALLASLNFA